MDIVYTTPNTEFIITKQNDPEWQAVFGFSSTYYNISKKVTMETEGGFEIQHSSLNLEGAFRWLRWIKVISTDEMNYQILQHKRNEEAINEG